MGGTISDWIIEGEKAGVKEMAKFHTDKLEDFDRLKKSGLPTFKDYRTPYFRFSKENKELADFISDYSPVVVRAVPVTKELPRRFRIGAKSLEECIDFLKDNVVKGRENEYNILLTEYEQNSKSGVIISNDKRVIAEVCHGNLDVISHGENPGASLAIDLMGTGHISDKMEWAIGGNEENRKDILKALKYLELTRDNFNPLYKRGYFEFVVTESKRILFADYKVNEMFFK